MRLLVILVLLALTACCSVAFGGFVLTVDNDVFMSDHTDRNYTHGMEAMWTLMSDGKMGWDVVRESYGLRSRMYSPDDITDPNLPPPSSRPFSTTS